MIWSRDSLFVSILYTWELRKTKIFRSWAILLLSWSAANLYCLSRIQPNNQTPAGVLFSYSRKKHQRWSNHTQTAEKTGVGTAKWKGMYSPEPNSLSKPTITVKILVNGRIQQQLLWSRSKTSTVFYSQTAAATTLNLTHSIHQASEFLYSGSKFKI